MIFNKESAPEQNTGLLRSGFFVFSKSVIMVWSMLFTSQKFAEKAKNALDKLVLQA